MRSWQPSLMGWSPQTNENTVCCYCQALDRGPITRRLRHLTRSGTALAARSGSASRHRSGYPVQGVEVQSVVRPFSALIAADQTDVDK